MSTVFIFHGIGGHPEENWFPWLKAELEKKGHKVIVPAFPDADEPDLDTWLNDFRQYEKLIDEETIFVGHSLGGSFALHLLERLNRPVKATFLVASVSGPTGSQFDPRMTSFIHTPYDWEKIRRNGGKMIVIHSDNDPYINLSQARHLAKTLGTDITLIPGGGHLNASAGCTQFPLLEHLITGD